MSTGTHWHRCLIVSSVLGVSTVYIFTCRGTWWGGCPHAVAKEVWGAYVAHIRETGPASRGCYGVPAVGSRCGYPSSNI